MMNHYSWRRINYLEKLSKMNPQWNMILECIMIPIYLCKLMPVFLYHLLIMGEIVTALNKLMSQQLERKQCIHILKFQSSYCCLSFRHYVHSSNFLSEKKLRHREHNRIRFTKRMIRNGNKKSFLKPHFTNRSLITCFSWKYN